MQLLDRAMTPTESAFETWLNSELFAEGLPSIDKQPAAEEAAEHAFLWEISNVERFFFCLFFFECLLSLLLSFQRFCLFQGTGDGFAFYQSLKGACMEERILDKYPAGQCYCWLSRCFACRFPHALMHS